MSVLLGTVRTMLLTLLRGRLHIGLLATGVLLVLLSVMLQELSVGETVRSFTAVSLAMQSLVVDVTAFAAALSLSHAYLIGRAAIPWLSRPVSRSLFFAAGVAAVVLATVLAGVVLTIPIALITAVYEGPVGRVTAAALVGGLEAVVVAVVAVSCRMRLSVAMTLTLTTAVVLLGRLDLLMTDMATRGIFGAGTLIIRAVQWVVPHLWLTDWTSYALAPEKPLPALWEPVVHVTLYAGAVFCVGLVWHRQADFAKDPN
jgi:hypothetical protein